MTQSLPFPRAAQGGRFRWKARIASLPTEQLLSWAGFATVVACSLFLNAWALSRNGLGNTYYAAAVRSMSESWHNFFFGAFDPGGFITVDKPPVFLWAGSLTVRVFGYSSWSLLLPSAVAGAASVALVWLIVKRYFGPLAATIAGAVLALTPISVAVDRLNLPEPFYILALVAAAGAVLQSVESRRWWAWIIAAGVFVGIAFNTKMLAAWIPGPALALAIVASQRHWRAALRQLPLRLALLATVTFIASASWMVVVDAWPATARPYVGGSTDNTESNLILGYNGFGRVDGLEGAGRGGGPAGGGAPTNGGFPGSRTGGSPFGNGGNAAGGFNVTPNGGFGSPGRSGTGQQRGNAPGTNGGTRSNAGGFSQGGTNQFPGGGPGVGGGNPATGAGGIIAGTPGWLRMFDDANGGQIAWLLPFALLGAALCLWHWRRDPLRRAATILFAGWVLLFAVVFSFAQGIYHSYYTAALAPGIAALVGMSAVAMVSLVRQNIRWLLAVAGVVGVTMWVQLTLSGRFPDFRAELRPASVAVAVLGVVFIALVSRPKWRGLAPAGMAVVIAGLLLLPASWATYETANASLNTTLPQAGPREGASGRSFGSATFDDGTASLAAWLKAHQDPDARWALATTSAQNASILIAQDDLSVMALGGFLGTDPTITVSQFADLVAKGDVRYVEVSGGGAGGGLNRGGFGGAAASGQGGSGTQAAGASAVTSAARSVCTAVTGDGLPAQYQGSIYDCAGKADALKGLG